MGISAPVAQLDRVPGYEPGGREFDKFAGSEFRMRLRLRSEPGGWRAGARRNLSGRAIISGHPFMGGLLNLLGFCLPK